MDVFKEIKGLLGRSETALSTVEQEIASLKASIADLEAAGMVNASPYMMNGEYLYLNHPTKNGEKRRREYIGKNPVKVAKALADVERFKKYKELSELLATLTNGGNSARYQLQHVLDDLRHSAHLASSKHLSDDVAKSVEKAVLVMAANPGGRRKGAMQ